MTVLEGSKLLVESDSIADFQLGLNLFGLQAFGVLIVPHFVFVTRTHFLECHLDATVVRTVIPQRPSAARRVRKSTCS